MSRPRSSEVAERLDFSRPAPPKPMVLSVARHWAAKVVEWLGPQCERVQIAGSIRRGRPWCNDIDLVVIPKRTSVADLIGAEIASRNNVTFFLMDYVEASCGKAKILAGLSTDPAQMIVQLPKCQLDVWMADESTWVTRLVCRTGSKDHNIYLAMRAKQLGLHWAPYKGLTNRKNELIPTASEEEFFRALNLEYVAPERRERR